MKLKRAAKMMEKADFLPIQLLRENTKQDVLFDKDGLNRLSSILHDDESHYRNKQPQIDFILYNDKECYISEVMVDPNEPAPGDTEIFVSSNRRDWTKAEFTLSKEKTRRYILKGEVFGCYLRIHFLNNSRGGSFVGIRYIRIKGTKQEHILLFK